MKVLFYYYGTENIGIEYISALLKANGHKTELIFDPGLQNNFYFQNKMFNFLNFERKLIKKTNIFNPDLIAFSSVTNLYPYVKEIATKMKSELDVPTIIGGIHATCLPKYVLNENCFDMVCRGEGEYALLELCNNLESRRRRYNIKNIWFKKNGNIIQNTLRPLLKDLDKLPFPDKDLFHRYGAFKNTLLMLTSRGCPHSCSFCVNNYIKRLYPNECYLRKHSVDYVIEALKLYLKKYKYSKIKFEDDTFVLNEKWNEDFCRKYKKEIGLPFCCNMAPVNVNEKFVKWLKYAGCQMIEMGVQTGNQKIRNKILNVNGSNKTIIKAARIIKKYKIRLKTTIIFGIPKENKKDMASTVRLNQKLKPHYTVTFLLYPYPKTDINVYSFKKNYLSKEKSELVKKGEGSYHNTLLINHQYKEYAYKYVFLTPLFMKLPKFSEWFFWKLIDKRYNQLHKILYFPSILCMNPAESVEKLMDLARAGYRTYKSR